MTLGNFRQTQLHLGNKKYLQYLQIQINCKYLQINYSINVRCGSYRIFSNLDFYKDKYVQVANTKAQRSMQRQMLITKLDDEKRNEWVRKVKNISSQVAKLKLNFTGYKLSKRIKDGIA